MYPHRIRLRGPWEYESLVQREEDAPLSGRVIMPWATGDSIPVVSGPMRFRRRFGYPGRIDAHERVWLVLEGIATPIQTAVNGASLGEGRGSFECDVTHLLGPRNELLVDAIDFAQDKCLWAEAALEIRCTAYLRGVRVRRNDGVIVATGEVVGQAEAPLDLYLIADRSPTGYAKVILSEGIQSFDLLTDDTTIEGEPISQVKIELVQGAVVWYTVEQELPARGARESGV